jgi:hypothetical protein
MHRTELLKFLRAKHETIIIGLSLVMVGALFGCGTYETHHKEWIGVFMFDSVTAGAVLLEYDHSSPKGNTFGDVEDNNVNVNLFRYDFKTQTLKKDRNLFSNMKDAGMYRVVEYNPPYLLQGARYDDGTVLFNLETGEKKILGIRVNHLSQGNQYISDADMIVNCGKMDTLFFHDDDNSSLYFYSEKSNTCFRHGFEKTNESWKQYYQIDNLGLTEKMKLNGLPWIYFDHNFFVNWEENWAPFYAINPDSTSVACNIDSLLIGMPFCDTFPKSNIALNRLMGSFKTNFFLGISEHDLFECNGKDSCNVRKISDGGISEK